MKTVDSIDELLGEFSQVVGNTEFQWPALRCSTVVGDNAELRLEGRNEKATFRIVPDLHPSRRLLQQVGSNEKGRLLLAPHIPDELAADYRRNAISHADLNGRLFIETPWLLLDREPKAQRFKNPVSEPDIFSLKSSRLPRALLSRRETAWTQEKLIKETGLSPGLVSRILQVLVRSSYVVRETSDARRSSAIYHLKDFDGLLDAWRGADNWRKRVIVRQYSVLGDDVVELARQVRDTLGKERVFFTQWFAAHLRHPYTTPPVVSAYVRTISQVEIPLGRRVDTGGNLWLLSPADAGVFRETQQAANFNLVADVQIYLDLLQVQLRGPEQAEELRQWEGFAR